MSSPRQLQRPRRLSALFLTRYGRTGASSRYRFTQYQQALAARGIDSTFNSLLDDDYLIGRYTSGRGKLARFAKGFLRRLGVLARARRYDVLVIEGELVPYFPAALERLLAVAGVPYVVDYDDAIFHYYDLSPRPLVRRFLGGKIATVMRHARCVVAGNDYLAEYARRAGAPRVEILPTVVDLDRYSLAPRSDRPAQPFTIGWIGSPLSSRYLAGVAPALARACEDGPTRVILIGAGDVALPGVHAERLRWSEATEVDDMRRFDVGIMPMPDEPWARGKCGLKLIQYMACGLPVVASPVGVNVQIVEPGINGFLARADDEWVEAFRTLRTRPTLGGEMGQTGRRKIEEQFSLAVAGPLLASILRGAATPAD
jgi:glycosyltransferase involved in cell wall biosynthesis